MEYETQQVNMRWPKPLKTVLDKMARTQGPLGQRRYTSTAALVIRVLTEFSAGYTECRAGANPSKTFGKRFETLYTELFREDGTDA